MINADKTHLIVMGTKKTAASRNEVSLVAGEHIIEHTRTEKLLGANICEDLKWNEHLLNNEQSVVRQLTSRINGLVKVFARGGLLFDSPWTMGDPSPWAMGDRPPSTGGLGGGGVNVFSCIFQSQIAF